METKVDIQLNRHIHLEDSMVMYGNYNAETLEKVINTVHQMHNTTTPNEKLFPGELSTAFTWYVNKNVIHHYPINSLLYLSALREKYVQMYKEFIMQLWMYAKAIRILAKGYLLTPRLWFSNKKTSFILLYKVSYFWHWYISKFDNSIPSIYPTIYAAAADTVTDRNNTSSYCRSK